MWNKVSIRVAMLAVLATAVMFGVARADAQSAPAPKAKAPAADASSMKLAIPDIPYTKFVLPNGLTVLVHEDHKTPVVAVNTWYHVGSKNEKPGKTGFAHLFEHLMFSGSENFNHVYLTELIRIGATDLNGTTNNDRTNYFENVPTSMLDFALFAESDRMGHLLAVLDQKKLDLQRGVVQNEKRQGENGPYGVVEQIETENTYPVGHPYSWTVIGSMTDLDAASLSDVQEWFKTYYGPNNVTVVLAGDITPEVAREKMEKYYGDIPPGPPIAKQEAWVAKRTGSHWGTVQDRVPQARLYREWNVPQAFSAEEPQLDLVAMILGGGKTSRLYKRLVYKDQSATSAFASDGTSEIGGQFEIIVTAKPGGDLSKSEAAANEELQSFLKNGPTQAELDLAKTQIFGNYSREMERIGGFGGKSDILAHCQTFTGNPDCYKTYLERVRSATAASVRKAANDWLSDGDYNLEVQPYPALKTAAAMDRSKEPALGAAMPLKLPALQKTTLPNGLKVVLAERHSAPIVHFDLMVDGGFSADPAGAPGTASFEQRMLEEGTPTRDSLKIAEDLDSINANFNAGVNMDLAFVDLDALKANMDKSLAIYADLILHPAFPEKEFTRLQKDRIAGIEREKVTPALIVRRVGPELLYGKGNPYSEPFSGTGTIASVSKMTREDLVKFHDEWFKPNNATLLIVGDTTLAEITPKLTQMFGSWKSGNVSKISIPQVPQPEKDVVYLVDRPGSGQSLIATLQLAPPSSDPDTMYLNLVNGIFGGGFGSRINMNLREDKHWSYGVGSGITPARGQRPFMSSSPIQTDKTKEAMAELVKEFKGIAGGKPITEKELKDQQSDSTLALPGNFETVAELSNAYRNILAYNLPEDYYNTYTEKILAVTPASANAIAEKYILPGHLIWIVVGDMSKVEAGIRELKIGEVHKIDADGNPVQ